MKLSDSLRKAAETLDNLEEENKNLQATEKTLSRDLEILWEEFKKEKKNTDLEFKDYLVRPKVEKLIEQFEAAVKRHESEAKESDEKAKTARAHEEMYSPHEYDMWHQEPKPGERSKEAYWSEAKQSRLIARFLNEIIQQIKEKVLA